MLEVWVFGEPTTKGYDGALGEGKKTDETIKYCEQCKYCWEKDKYMTKQGNNVPLDRSVYHYYKDFPIYGKKRQICPKCK